MAMVTKYNFYLHDGLKKKIDLMIQRCTHETIKQDAVLGIEGGEGEGKTTLSILIGFYISDQTGRPFSEKNLFFDTDKMLKFSQETEGQIIIWDEPALQALSTDWASKSVKNILRMVMMCRKKRHFLIINMTKFYKFPEYFVVDRMLGLIHIYSRKNIETGNFVYIRKNKLEDLYRDYKFGKRRNYKKYASKKLRSTFPNVLNPKYEGNVLEGFNVEIYDKEKDNAINMIGNVIENKTPTQIKNELIHKQGIYNLKVKENIPTYRLGQLFGVNQRTIQRICREMEEKATNSTRINN